MIPQEYIQEVVARNDITEVIGQYVQLRHRGRTYTGLCPFHNEKTPSFTVYPDTQSFYCFGCGAAGDVINFVRKISNLGYVEAVKQLAGRAGMPMPEEDDQESRSRSRLLEINRNAARYFYDQLNAPTPEAAMARRYWREKRGLSDAAIRRFGLGYAPEDFVGLLHYLRHRGFTEPELESSGLVKRSAKGNLYDIFRHRVMVPIIDVRGNIIAFGGRVMDDSKPKYINSPETMVYHKSRTLFALNVAKKSTSKRYILCEGYMDVISMHEAGFDTAVCACGTALTPEQVKLLTEYADEVVLSYDSDEAGQKATERSLALFSGTNLQVRVLNIPGAKDPDEFIRTYGRDRFEAVLEGTATPLEFKLAKAVKNMTCATMPSACNMWMKPLAFWQAARSAPRRGMCMPGALRSRPALIKRLCWSSWKAPCAGPGAGRAAKSRTNFPARGLRRISACPMTAGAKLPWGLQAPPASLWRLCCRMPAPSPTSGSG